MTDVYCAHSQMVEIEKVIPNPRNPNKHSEKQIALLSKIIAAQGWRAPITVSTRSGFIVRGHGRLLAARKLGLAEVPVDYQAYETEAAEWADLIADNRLSELSETDDLLLKDLLQELGTGELDLELTAYTADEIDQMLGSAKEVQEDDFDADKALSEIDEAKTKLGDIYILGKHRLMCGDSTDAAAVEKLMDGQKADIAVTDPPYNVGYTGGTKDALTIQNDKQEDSDFRQFLSAAFTNMDAAMKPGAVFYIWHADSEGYNFRAACKEAGWQVRQCLIWNKNQLVMGRQDYHWKHEPCLYGWKEGAAHLWASDRKQTTILCFDRPQKNAEHPTMKPVALLAYQIANNTKGEDIALDLFGGSGTTLVACEQLGRKCYMMELDPKYCDVIIKRWEELTGNKAELCSG